MKQQRRSAVAVPTSATAAAPAGTVLTSPVSSVSSSSSNARRRKRNRPQTSVVAHFSAIECGSVDSAGARHYYEMNSWFGGPNGPPKSMEIYTAAIDPERRILYRASVLAEKFGCATNKVGMYLARRRQASSGLYQATSFLHKPMGRTGLKSGGYFCHWTCASRSRSTSSSRPAGSGCARRAT